MQKTVRFQRTAPPHVQLWEVWKLCILKPLNYAFCLFRLTYFHPSTCWKIRFIQLYTLPKEREVKKLKKKTKPKIPKNPKPTKQKQKQTNQTNNKKRKKTQSHMDLMCSSSLSYPSRVNEHRNTDLEAGRIWFVTEKYILLAHLVSVHYGHSFSIQLL